ncbi:phosphoribosylanthranilate isomerase [Bacteroides sp. 224]|uniref:phosphoribosylanthranilate isomerase n=1 Tax=Bacteroides sp. 224 TaxID=2302936 RepID=UPI0013D4931E|nr:phosphoribosylanthranilate isomerase [Bacteroides sp. 224]NDV65207.1 phosphoribosylanthranilate isomerase [Bacteroides sp. 224]
MINGKLIKVCGMLNGENIREIENLGVDMIGFIFYPKSPRYIMEMPHYLPQKAKRVGVFVNEDKETIKIFGDRFSLDYIQLHGKESPEYCRTLKSKGVKIIKAFSIAHEKDLEEVYLYEDSCDYFLFDTKCKQYGGSGSQFDWGILKAYQGTTPFLLSGGINLYSVRELKEFIHPQFAGIDINSRFEIKPGYKDMNRIKAFLEQFKK